MGAILELVCTIVGAILLMLAGKHEGWGTLHSLAFIIGGIWLMRLGFAASMVKRHEPRGR